MKYANLHGEVIEFSYMGEKYRVIVESVTKSKIEGTALPGFTIYDFDLDNIQNLIVLDSEILGHGDLFGLMEEFLDENNRKKVVEFYKTLGFTFYYDSSNALWYLVKEKNVA